MPEAEEELVAGYQTEYSGMKFAFFYLASYLNLLVSSLFVTIFFLGGWHFSIPFLSSLKYFQWNLLNNGVIYVVNIILGIVITLIKSYLFLFISIMTRWTLPRIRVDQLLNLGWKFLLPIALGNLLLTTSFQLFLL